MTTKGRRWEGDAKRKSEGAAAALGVGGRVKQEPSRLTLIYFRTPTSSAACARSAANWGSEGPARALLGGQGSWRLVGREACAHWPGPPMPSHAHGRPWEAMPFPLHACRGLPWVDLLDDDGWMHRVGPAGTCWDLSDGSCWPLAAVLRQSYQSCDHEHPPGYIRKYPLLQASPLIYMYQTRALPFPILGMCQSAWTAHSNCGLLLQVHHTCTLAQIALVCASQPVAVVGYPASLRLLCSPLSPSTAAFLSISYLHPHPPNYTTYSQMHTNTTNRPCGRGLISI
ncbi:hypothetical protein COCSADRAFT_352733 [Bipolaris sorokiniana ND90Pr]|uniref:Uncharacterized protein n=1 Tax=Cochliobolus sativus (strain ND90Pr / ATCC 201652) TaxID=665912 RepID=M2TG69_COCSN|nr:uncharacterized protein COCSADRAFT_352733 [Bipolaris sorokiniana ND90Pr]EMD67727.1 hypothetical protein COCSADRAFT_352733 [Bipolaris sorokiniana ND90Pr]